MSFGAFYSAVSGVQGHLFSMSIVGNNIANSNTSGYKSGQVHFREALVQTLRGGTPPRQGFGGRNPLQVGLGMAVGSIHENQGQGVLQETGTTTDLALEGRGYFILSDGGGNRFYTRAGGFTFDSDGMLVSRTTGHAVQGWMARPDGNIPTGAPVDNIALPFGQAIPGQATTEVNFSANLNAAATDSIGSLADAGTSGIDTVKGKATNGAGGQHQVVITGNNATQSTASGTNTTGAGLTGTETLASLGVTDFNFELSIDGMPPARVEGLTGSTTVDQLISTINGLDLGVTAALDGAGEVSLTRDKYGIGGTFNVTTSLAAAGDITDRLFGASVGSAFVANNGLASTLAAQDTFVPTGSGAMTPTVLDIVFDEKTGLAVGLDGVGGGGLEVMAADGLAAGTALIDTEATEHLTSILVYDSLGEPHTVNVTFARTAVPNTWTWEGTFADGEPITSGRRGTVEFNTDGSVASFDFDNGGDTMIFNPGPNADPVSLNFWSGTQGDWDGLTQFASAFTARLDSQDGYATGTLNSISIDHTGGVTGFFNNGQVRTLAQVVLAQFSNPSGLNRVGGSLYQLSPNSGTPVEGAAGSVIPASIVSGALEASNVDLSEEFVKMITSQRGFQANARVITTGDEMMTDMINLKR